MSGGATGRTAVPVHARWRLLADPDPADGFTNMAVDQALLDAVAEGAPPALRFYRWSPATLSFGRNQPVRGLYDTAAAARRGIGLVRRPTGGQAVLHDDELTYAVAAPIEIVGKPRAAYASINRSLVDGLRRIGVDATVAGDGVGADRHDWRWACFRRPERGEVVVRSRKLVGSAQRMENRTILQHGSILLGGSQTAAEELLLERDVIPGPDPAETPDHEGGWTTLRGELGRGPGLNQLVDALVAGFEAVLGLELTPSTLGADEAAAADALRPRFASDAWTLRR